jgi:microcystin synthetase protein McyC
MNNVLHTLFEEQVGLHPKSVAIRCESKEITYQELDNRSNQLAHYLIYHGVKSGDVVNICIHRSIEMIIAVIGVLKSGAAYGPIGTETPLERLNYLLNDTKSKILLTDSKTASKYAFNINISQKHILLDAEWDEVKTFSSVRKNSEHQESSLAVILYTSGSTGKPKGVQLSHQSLVNRLIWDTQTYKHLPSDIVLQHASLAFDFSILEIFMALGNGGKLILARPDFHYDSFYLIELIQAEKITKMGSVPSLLKSYINLPAFKQCTSLKQVFLGGEALSKSLQELFFANSSAELVNIYGPTEASISVLNWTCNRNSKEKIIPIGMPVNNITIYLLDEQQQMVPEFEAGEIYIAGIGVGIGYHNAPKLTQAQFLNINVGEQSIRMFKTGDLGKKLPNGAIQFLGRKDYQVKLRGLRIELEEIEYVLNSHKNINSSCIKAIKNQNSQTKLVAYVIPDKNKSLKIKEIKEYLTNKLPDYMVPSLFVEMAMFPLSANGKIDRNNLPEPERFRLLTENSYQKPQNECQQKLTKIWESVLQISPIGIDDTFSSIGGDSLALMQILVLIENEMGYQLSLSSLSTANTIRSQVEAVESGLDDKKIKLFNENGQGIPIVFVRHVYGEGISISISLMERLSTKHPFIATLPLGEHGNKMPDTIEKIAHYYVNLIEELYPQNEYILGGYSMGGLVAYEMACILNKRNKIVKKVFMIDSYHPAVVKYETKLRFIKCIYRILNPIEEFQGRRDALGSILPMSRLIFKNNLKPEEIDQANRYISLNLEPSIFSGNVVFISAKNAKSFVLKDIFNERVEKLNTRAWQNCLLGSFSQYAINCNHDTIIQEPNINIVADIINSKVLKD